MLAACLVGTGAWSSTRCTLNWKLKATKSNRLYLQLLPSARRTEEIGYGSLPTPRAADVQGGGIKNVQYENGSFFRANKDGVRWGVKLRDVLESGLLPTPMASDSAQGSIISPRDTYYMTSTGIVPRKLTANGTQGSVGLSRMVQMLPTPRAGSQEGYESRAKRKGHSAAMSYLESALEYHLVKVPEMLPTPIGNDAEKQGDLRRLKNKNVTSAIQHVFLPTPTAQDSRGSMPGVLGSLGGRSIGWTLQPDLVSWMMGFPTGWTELPFLSGAWSH